jgi:hypothetical protein
VAALAGAGFDVGLQPWPAPEDLHMTEAVASGAGVLVELRPPPADVGEAPEQPPVG